MANPYLRPTPLIDFHHPAIQQLAATLAAATPAATARACFEWVRDQVRHSSDHQLNPVTSRASDVLHHRTGYCYAKSHLLAALLRANGIAAGFSYQRLSVDDTGAPYCLHGLNGVYLPEHGWYRIDPRGNRSGIDAQFCPPREQLAYQPRLAAERDFPAILPEPLPVVVEALQRWPTWDALGCHLPDVSDAEATALGLTAAPHTMV